MKQANKRLLVISYYWPPSGGITVLRTLKLVKYLSELGWECVVFTTTPDGYEVLDDRNAADVPDSVQVHRIASFNPIRSFKQFTGRKKSEPMLDVFSKSQSGTSRWDNLGVWIRGNFFIPDARAPWIRPTVKAILNWSRDHAVDAMFSDGPPHSNTAVALAVKKQLNIPWLADFQDPWTQVDYYEKMRIGKRADRRHKAMEQAVFQHADAITIASPTWKKDLESIGARNVEVLYYGYDERDFEGIEPSEPDAFVVFHGGLLGADRNPRAFFQALSELRDQRFDRPVQIRLAGQVDQTVIEAAEEVGLGDSLVLLGYITRRQVLQELASASLLIMPINQASNAAGRIPGKLFELMRAGKPILAFGDPDGDVARLLKETGTGALYRYEDLDGIRTALQAERNAAPSPSSASRTPLSAFSNERLAGTVAQRLEQLVNRSR